MVPPSLLLTQLTKLIYSSKSLCSISICKGLDKLLFNQTTTGRQSSFLLACLLVHLCEYSFSSIYFGRKYWTKKDQRMRALVWDSAWPGHTSALSIHSFIYLHQKLHALQTPQHLFAPRSYKQLLLCEIWNTGKLPNSCNTFQHWKVPAYLWDKSRDCQNLYLATACIYPSTDDTRSTSCKDS